MADPLPTIAVIFFKSEAGREPVREWLRDLERDDRRAIGTDLLLVQQLWPVGLPLCRSLGTGLWELRSRLPSRTTARIIFTFHQSKLVLLNGFIKKTQKTPRAEIDLSLDRLKEMMS